MVFSWELPDCFWWIIGNKGKKSSFFLCQINIYCKGCTILYLERLIDGTLVHLLRKFWWNQSNAAIKLSLVKGQVHILKHLQFVSVSFFFKAVSLSSSLSQTLFTPIFISLSGYIFLGLFTFISVSPFQICLCLHLSQFIHICPELCSLLNFCSYLCLFISVSVSIYLLLFLYFQFSAC